MTIRHEARNRYGKFLNRYPDINLDFEDYNTLRRAAVTLHSWYESECNGARQQDEETGLWYWHSTHTGNRLHPCKNLEKGAMQRIADTCVAAGLHFYLQTDPRGGTLYISDTPLNEQNYTSGFFVA